MRKLFTVLILAGLCCCMAYAGPMVWTLDGVTFASGGTATGTFAYDPLTNKYSSVNISVPGHSYVEPPAIVITGGALASSATLLEVQDNVGSDQFELSLRFTGPGLTAAGGTVLVDVGPQDFDRVSR